MVMQGRRAFIFILVSSSVLCLTCLSVERKGIENVFLKTGKRPREGGRRLNGKKHVQPP